MAKGKTTNVVSESLLSWAKDVRYVDWLRSLLQEAVEPLLSRNFSSSTLEKGSWYASLVLYALLIVVPRGRSLGMQVLGLNFENSQKHQPKRLRLTASLVALILGTGVVDWWATNKPQDEHTAVERLRGNDRRRRHDLLRQQMLERANNTLSNAVRPGSHSTITPTNSSQVRLVDFFRKVVKSIVEGFSGSLREGPHASQQQRNNTPENTTIISWMMRLHMVNFLVTGDFPTLVHRILGLRQVRETESQTRIPVSPNTHRLIALLIGVQSSSWILRYLVTYWTQIAASWLEENSSKESKRMLNENSAMVQKDTRRSNPTDGRRDRSLCAICHKERTHSAVSSSCGHVFCWNCLNHWVWTVKKACPYCRSPCRPEDIQPLYNYTSLAPSPQK